MADSAPDPKVEDVLSSVRRLVSQEIPRRPVSRSEDGADALVLTSAQRIEGQPKLQPAASRPRSLEQRIAELEAAVDSGMQEFEPDGSEDQAQHRPDRIVYTRPPKSEESASVSRASLRLSEIALIETGPANEDDSASDTPLEFRHDGGEGDAPMAEDVPTLPPKRAELKAFSDPDDVVEHISARIGQDENGRTVVSVPPPFVQPVEPVEDEEFEAALTNAVRDSLVADEPEAADDDSEDAVAPEPLELTDAVALDDFREEADEGDKIAAVVHDIVEASEAKEAASPATPEVEEPIEVNAEAVEAPSAGDETAVETAAAALEALPNEDAMRLLVSRLIREELQGELGERITRNVRKLVRREVARAVASRDLS